MEQSPIRQRLARGEVVVGSWINTASPIVAELMAASGFDFLAVDAEHSPVDVAQMLGLFQAIRSGNRACEAFVRMPGSDYETTKRYLDAGATGVVAPLVVSEAQARTVVGAVKYPPQGVRGVGFCRDNVYGAGFTEAVASANDRTTVVMQIEHIDAVRAIDSILSVEGVDAAFIGPYDLSASMGLTGQIDHDDVQAAMRRILDACRAHGVAPGLHVVAPDPEALLRRADEGYRLLAYSLDITMLNASCRGGLETIRRRLGG